MTQAEYEELKAQILAEQKEAKKARAKERERIRREAYRMFDATKEKYLPKLIMKHGKLTGNYDCGHTYRRIIENARRATLDILHEPNELRAYEHGKAEEGNRILSEMLEEILNT